MTIMHNADNKEDEWSLQVGADVDVRFAGVGAGVSGLVGYQETAMKMKTTITVSQLLPTKPCRTRVGFTEWRHGCRTPTQDPSTNDRRPLDGASTRILG